MSFLYSKIIMIYYGEFFLFINYWSSFFFILHHYDVLHFIKQYIFNILKLRYNVSLIIVDNNIRPLYFHRNRFEFCGDWGLGMGIGQK